LYSLTFIILKKVLVVTALLSKWVKNSLRVAYENHSSRRVAARVPWIDAASAEPALVELELVVVDIVNCVT
jgi:hypothetical protein